jgi:hypothetical protein
MPRRFALPTVSRRQVSTSLVVLVMTLAVVYLVAFRMDGSGRAGDQALQAFRNDCVKAARHANGGGDLVMDDDTEARIGAYCGCVAAAVKDNVAPPEIARIAQGTASAPTFELLERIVSGCRPQLAR